MHAMLSRAAYKRCRYLPWSPMALLCLSLWNCAVVEQQTSVEPIVGATEAKTQPSRSRTRVDGHRDTDTYEVLGKRYRTLKTSAGFRERGIASWYGGKFHGRKTSSGEVYDMYKLTAAHKHLPLPTRVRVTNLENGKNVVLRVNDRGPFHDNRIIDLSYAAAKKLDITKKGTAFVEVVALDGKQPPSEKLAVKPPVQTDAGQSEKRFYLQIGAFQERQNAERLSALVAQYTPKSVRIHESKRGESSVYRVQVGPIANIVLADQLVATLVGLGIDNHHFVTN